MTGGGDSEWHVLGLSGGRDSAALAVHMRQNHPELQIDYFFTDTGKELPEVYEFLGKARRVPGETDTSPQPRSGFRFLAPPIQELFALSADALVYPAVEAAALRAMDKACAGQRYASLQLRGNPR